MLTQEAVPSSAIASAEVCCETLHPYIQGTVSAACRPLQPPLNCKQLLELTARHATWGETWGYGEQFVGKDQAGKATNAICTNLVTATSHTSTDIKTFASLTSRPDTQGSDCRVAVEQKSCEV